MLYKNVYIYGAGSIAKKVLCSLADANIHIKGVIVSTKNKEKKYFMGLPLIALDDLLDHEDTLVLLALNKSNSNEVIPNLQKKDIKYIELQ